MTKIFPRKATETELEKVHLLEAFRPSGGISLKFLFLNPVITWALNLVD